MGALIRKRDSRHGNALVYMKRDIHVSFPPGGGCYDTNKPKVTVISLAHRELTIKDECSQPEASRQEPDSIYKGI